ncbi:MAG TPA: hypothetical protein DCY80_02160 [Solibacterales bacterium]|nr:hypothetical protein [Bryobacterales bacterium]
MAVNQQQDRKHVHAMIDRLAPQQVNAIRTLLEVMVPNTAEDEEITAEEEAAVARSKEWFRQNEGIPLEDVAVELGLSMEQIRAAAKDPAA